MSIKLKALQAAAGSAGERLDVDDVFSIDLYNGTGNAGVTVNNGIDLSGEGGLVWFKSRTITNNWAWFDTERGTGKALHSNDTDAQETESDTLTSFNSNGFTVDTDNKVNSYTATDEIASWTFRKAPKFFDVVTYSGDTTDNRQISHNLGSVPGMIIVKMYNSNSRGWYVYHRSLDSGSGEYQRLDLTLSPPTGDNPWSSDDPTDSYFVVGNGYETNRTGYDYVAYLFAHNDGDGEFGPNGDQDIIKCGSFNLPSYTDVNVSLGFEPQFVLVKNMTSTDSWRLLDTMRGAFIGNQTDSNLYLNAQTYEQDTVSRIVQPTPDGFIWQGSGGWGYTGDIMYVAIRRGPLAEPSAGTDVFDVEENFLSTFSNAGFDVDMVLGRTVNTTQDWRNFARLFGTQFLVPNSTAAISSLPHGEVEWDSNTGFYQETNATPNIWYQWKRAPGFFDVVVYEGTGVGNRLLNHNLGAVPEMIWTKNLQNTTDNNWVVYHKDTSTKRFALNQTTGSNDTNYTNLTSTSVTLNDNTTNDQVDYVSYFFATLDGISKVGSFSHTFGSDTNVDCGFDSGARFVLIKNTTASGHWIIWDSVRGIVAGNDDRIFLSSSAAENTATDAIDPYSQGFTITGNWAATGTYIFYAIA